MIFAHEQDQILSAFGAARTAADRQFQAQPARRLFEVEGRYPGRNDARVRRHRRDRLSLRLFEHEIPAAQLRRGDRRSDRSEEHTSELQSLMRISYAVFCLKQKTKTKK